MSNEVSERGKRAAELLGLPATEAFVDEADKTMARVALSKNEEWTAKRSGIEAWMETLDNGLPRQLIAAISFEHFWELKVLAELHNASLASQRKQLEQAESIIAAHIAIMELPDDYCPSCGGTNGHEEGCKGVNGLMALNRQLSAHRVELASQRKQIAKTIRRLLAINDELWAEEIVEWRQNLYFEAHELAKGKLEELGEKEASASNRDATGIAEHLEKGFLKS